MMMMMMMMSSFNSECADRTVLNSRLVLVEDFVFYAEEVLPLAESAGLLRTSLSPIAKSGLTSSYVELLVKVCLYRYRLSDLSFIKSQPGGTG